MSEDPYLPADASTEPLGGELAVPRTAVEGKVFDGEFVDEAAAGVPGPAAAPVIPPWARFALRHGAYVAVGAWVAWRKWRAPRSLPAKMAQAAAASGDHEGALKWAQLHVQQRKERHGNVMERIEKTGHLLLLVPKMALGLAVGLFVLGVLMAGAEKRSSAFPAPFLALAHLVAFAFAVASVAWTVACIAAVPAVLAVLYLLGRFAGDLAPAWAVTSADADVDVAIDERAVTQALGALRIPQIKDFLATGAPMAYLVPCRQEGRGTYFEVRLPLGLPASEITKPARRVKLAAGLYRKATEVWPSVGADESVLRGWVADKGALDEGAGPYPLLEAGLTDVFKGLPFGVSLRGDPVKIPVIGRNTLCGGMPEQGKSNAARVVAAGYTLDIITELRIYVPDTNFDFERYKPRCARYVMGTEDEHIEQILGELEELYEELQSRGRLLVDMEQEEVTYALAHAGIGLHPVFVLVEEAHIVIQHHKFKKDFERLLPDIVKLDRKRGVHMMLSTQAPTKDSMPRDVTRNCTNGIAYAVGDHVANDALLGQGAYRGGHRATELIPGANRGTALCKGFSSEARSEMVQAHRVSGRSGDDQVSPLVKRALAEMGRKGRALPGSGRPLAIESRDLLTDIGEAVKGNERMNLRDVIGLLRAYAPRFDRYKKLTAAQLREDLAARGVRTVNTSGTHYLDTPQLREVLARDGE
jgi:S-DNA-T family DNA segregation ATPase FtsK/SpoIIIE